MDVTAKYELIGLMAYPIRHSLSPEMQNKALEKAGLPFTYMAFEVDVLIHEKYEKNREDIGLFGI